MARFRREPSRNRGGNGPKRNPHDLQGLSFSFDKDGDYWIILGCELLKRMQSSTIMAKTNFKTMKWPRFWWVEKYPQLQESWAGPHTREGWKGGNGKSPTEPQSGENLQNPESASSSWVGGLFGMLVCIAHVVVRRICYRTGRSTGTAPIVA